MPKDYQEVERIIQDFRVEVNSNYYEPMDLDGNNKDLADWLRTTLTTYGNARELEGVEKVEKGVPAEKELKDCGVCNACEMAMTCTTNEAHRDFNICRNQILDHIAKVKSELGFRPVGSPEQVPVSSITNKLN